MNAEFHMEQGKIKEKSDTSKKNKTRDTNNVNVKTTIKRGNRQKKKPRKYRNYNLRWRKNQKWKLKPTIDKKQNKKDNCMCTINC